jgi:glyoxylase-like metal-dependent hydrolase (beta-lactamase superfamily II)
MDRNTHFVINRRKFLASAAALVAAGLLPRETLALAGPMKMTHGALELTIVGDGELILPIAVLAVGTAPEAVAALLKDAVMANGTTKFAANVTVVKDGADIILLDAGSGAGFQPTAGKLMENLAAAGIDPASVTKVVFTHGHPDHLFGAAKDGALNFPNASFHANQAEFDFWNDKELFAKFPKEMHGMITGAVATYGAMKDKLAMFKPGDAITSNISALETYGHTPGHVSFEFAGDGGMIFVGDSIPNNIVHFAHPEWPMAFDADGEKAVATRKALLDRAATEKIKLLGYHWRTPVGMAEKKDGAYTFVAMA